MGPIDNNKALLKIMAWPQIGDKPLPKSILARFTDVYIYAAPRGDHLRIHGCIVLFMSVSIIQKSMVFSMGTSFSLVLTHQTNCVVIYCTFLQFAIRHSNYVCSNAIHECFYTLFVCIILALNEIFSMLIWNVISSVHMVTKVLCRFPAFAKIYEVPVEITVFCCSNFKHAIPE